MMTGRVVALHVLLPVTFRLQGHPDLIIEFVVDTGFTGYLTLPVAAVNTLQLPYIESIPAYLATDDEVELPVHAVTILWHVQEEEVRVLAMGRRPLLGSALLSGSALAAQFIENGHVGVDVVQPQ